MSLNVKYEHTLQDIAFLGGHHIQYIPHLHRELELICLLEGDVIAYADSVRYELHAGDIFLTFPNQIHSYEKVTEETHVGFIFKPDLLPELMDTFTIGTPTSPVIEGAKPSGVLMIAYDHRKSNKRIGFESSETHNLVES